jgi:DNA-binding phage protein
MLTVEIIASGAGHGNDSACRQGGCVHEAFYRALSPIGDPRRLKILGVMKALGIKFVPVAA